MLTKSRALLTVALSLAASAAPYGLAYAESQADIAAKENDEGRDLMYGGKYDEATAKFRDAVARVPEAKYFFNLCTSLYEEGKYGESLTACNSAEQNKPDDSLKAKIEKMSGRIKEEAQKQGLDLQPVGGGGGDPNTPPSGPNPNNEGGDPNQQPPGPNPNGNGGAPNQQPPGPNGGPPPMPGQGQPVRYRSVQGRPPPSQAVFADVRPDHNYLWTLGVDVFGGGGQMGNSGAYGNASVGFRVKSDFLFNRPNRIGAQFYLQYTTLGAGNDQMATSVDSLAIVDIGAALYKHFCLLGQDHVCITPLVGGGIALMSPSEDQAIDGKPLFSYGAASVRAEISAQYAFGPRLQNVLQIMVGVNAYSAVLSEPSDGSPMSSQIGLNSGGALGYFGLGYTYRFNAPLGQRAFITLE